MSWFVPEASHYRQSCTRLSQSSIKTSLPLSNRYDISRSLVTLLFGPLMVRSWYVFAPHEDGAWINHRYSNPRGGLETNKKNALEARVLLNRPQNARVFQHRGIPGVISSATHSSLLSFYFLFLMSYRVPVSSERLAPRRMDQTWFSNIIVRILIYCRRRAQ